MQKNYNGVTTRPCKKFEDMCNRFDTIPACDRRTHILRRHSPRYAYLLTYVWWTSGCSMISPSLMLSTSGVVI